VLAGPPDGAADAARAGIDYRPMGGSMESFLAGNRKIIDGNRLPIVRAIKRKVDREVAAQFELLAGLACEADRVVAASLVFAARACAEKAGKPYRFIAFAPETFASRHHPALGERRQSLPKWLNRISWWFARRIDNYLLRRPINRGRTALGLPPIRDVLAHFADPARSLLATDAELAPAPPDVPLSAAPAGAMLFDDGEPLPAPVEAFLAAGSPPVFVGFGSMPDAQPGRTLALIVEAIRRTGCRAIVSTSAAGPEMSALGQDLLCVGRLPHARLFPRLALAVHHGGAGTCARAARAGIPQVIVPHLLDQFPWSTRLARRGLAPEPLFRRDLTSQALAARIRTALDDPTMRERAASLARTLVGRDGAEAAAEILTRS